MPSRPGALAVGHRRPAVDRLQQKKAHERPPRLSAEVGNSSRQHLPSVLILIPINLAPSIIAVCAKLHIRPGSSTVSSIVSPFKPLEMSA